MAPFEDTPIWTELWTDGRSSPWAYVSMRILDVVKTLDPSTMCFSLLPKEPMFGWTALDIGRRWRLLRWFLRVSFASPGGNRDKAREDVP